MKKILLIGLLAFSSLSASDKFMCDLYFENFQQARKKKGLLLEHYPYINELININKKMRRILIELVSRDCLKYYYTEPKNVEKHLFKYLDDSDKLFKNN